MRTRPCYGPDVTDGKQVPETLTNVEQGATHVNVSPVSPALPIIATVGWVMVLVATVIPAMFSAMLFDSGGSVPAMLIFAGLWLTLPLCLASIAAGWILWALTRHRRSGGLKVARGFAYLLPLLGLVTAGIGLLWISTACSGNLSC
jgi:hypothetical protein